MGKDFWVILYRNREWNFTDGLWSQDYSEGTQSIGAFELNPDMPAGALITHYLPQGKTARSQRENWLRLNVFASQLHCTTIPQKRKLFICPHPLSSTLFRRLYPIFFFPKIIPLFRQNSRSISARYLPKWVNDRVKSHQGYYIL